MISRFKWYAIRFPCTVAEAFQKLEGYRYDPTRATGFVVDESNLSFQFFWTTPIYATVIDSDGVSSRNEIFSISSQSAKILGTDRLVMRMQDPPRSSRELFNSLERILGFGFTCEKIMITDEVIRKSIESFGSVTLNSIKISGSIPSMSALARLELVSKEGVDFNKIDDFKLERVLVESALYATKHKGLSGSVGFTRSGICKISGDLGPLIQNNIERCLLDLFSLVKN
jgi:hypothetical protein